VRLLLNIEQLLSEEVSVFEEVIFVKMPEMVAMLPNHASSLERPLQYHEPYSYNDEAIKTVHIIIIHICLQAIGCPGTIHGRVSFRAVSERRPSPDIEGSPHEYYNEHERGQMLLGERVVYGILEDYDVE
jgi:hypothetical protein